MLSIPTTIATNASAASSSREMGSVTPLCLEEHHDGTGAAVETARLDEREHVVAAREELADALAQHRLAPGRAQALAMDDAHAAQAPSARIGEEPRGLQRRLLAREAVQ